VPLASINDLVLSLVIFEENAYEAALHAGVLERDHSTLKPELSRRWMKAVFDQRYVKRLNGTHVKQGADKWSLPRR
jgi:myo-inositol-1-phosphate synthase